MRNKHRTRSRVGHATEDGKTEVSDSGGEGLFTYISIIARSRKRYIETDKLLYRSKREIHRYRRVRSTIKRAPELSTDRGETREKAFLGINSAAEDQHKA